MLSVATFGVGFLVRPFGGILIGIYSDRAGRKAALSLTILLMCAGTAIIGLAPTYSQIGMAAPCLIVLARLLQGFSAGGEMGTATAFLTEHAPKGKKAYYSSWIQTSIGFAVLLGACFGTGITLGLSTADMESWGWRIPFLSGLLIGPIGFFTRRNLDETPVFLDAEKSKTPLGDVLRHYPWQAFASFAMVVLGTVCIYVILFYMPTFSVKVLKLPQSASFIAAMGRRRCYHRLLAIHRLVLGSFSRGSSARRARQWRRQSTSSSPPRSACSAFCSVIASLQKVNCCRGVTLIPRRNCSPL